MFGSLVAYLPTNFKGGELVLRHDGKEHKYEAGNQWQATALDDDSVAVPWISFFSDVDHEVLPVTEGHRVTLTYVSRAHLSLHRSSHRLPFQNLFRSEFASSTGISKVLLDHEDLKPAIQEALQDPTFLPDGCLLGFGLSHKYPVEIGTEMKDVKLKGCDALLMNSFQALGLKSEIRALYGPDESYRDQSGKICFTDGEEHWLTSTIIDLDCGCEEEPWSYAFEPEPGEIKADAMEVSSYGADEIDKNLEEKMHSVGKELKGERQIWKRRSTLDMLTSKIEYEYRKQPPILLWVTRPSEASRIPVNYIHYGNQPTLDTKYADLNLVVTIPPANKRAKLLM
jgi:hypothetical protein